MFRSSAEFFRALGSKLPRSLTGLNGSPWPFFRQSIRFQAIHLVSGNPSGNPQNSRNHLRPQQAGGLRDSPKSIRQSTMLWSRSHGATRSRWIPVLFGQTVRGKRGTSSSGSGILRKGSDNLAANQKLAINNKTTKKQETAPSLPMVPQIHSQFNVEAHSSNRLQSTEDQSSTQDQ